MIEGVRGTSIGVRRVVARGDEGIIEGVRGTSIGVGRYDRRSKRYTYRS